MPDAPHPRVLPRVGAFLFTVYGALALVGIVVLSLLRGYFGLGALAGSLALVSGASYLWAAWSLRGVQAAEALESSACFPGDAVTVSLMLQNRKLWPLAWIRLQRPKVPHLRASGELWRSGDGEESVHFGSVPGLGEVPLRYEIVPERRGVYRLGPTIVTSGDPFGLFRRSRDLPVGPELLAYPVSLDLGTVLPSWPDPLGERQARDFLHADPLASSGVRDYAPGDPLRLINWVATARVQRLQSNVLEGSVAPRAVLVLGAPEPRPLPWSGPLRELAFELLVSSAASLAMALAGGRVEVGLLAAYRMAGGPDDCTYLHPGAGGRDAHLQEILSRLARLTAAPSADAPSVLRWSLPARSRLLVLGSVYHAQTHQDLQIWAQGRPLDWFVLDPGPDDPPPGVHALFPGWPEDRELRAALLGPQPRGA